MSRGRCKIILETEKTIGSRLKFLRERRNLKQTDVASAVGLSVSQYSNIETGYAKSTKLQTAIALADFYGVSLDFITGRTDIEVLDDNSFVFTFDDSDNTKG